MKKFYKFLLALFLVTQPFLSQATHIVGADLTYRWVSGNTYEITLTAYRDCEGIPIQPTFRIDYSSLTCNVQNTLIVRLDGNPSEITPVCPTVPTTCAGGTQIGIQKYTYKGTVTLPSQCSDWTFSWRDCNRNRAITNLLDPQNQCLYIEATLNNLAFPQNSSPQFLQIPVSVLCLNQVNLISQGTIDTDGDQITYTLVNPRVSKFQTVNYKPGFSGTNPMSSSTGYALNTALGSIAVSPTLAEITVSAILVQEFRNGQLVGSVMRDMQILTRDCANDLPRISGIDGGNLTEVTICAGKQVCFDVLGSDANAGQILQMTWDPAFDTTYAKFQITANNTTRPKGRFCLDPPGAIPGKFIFTVTLKDNFCPIRGVTTKTFVINVNAGASILFAPSPINIPCNTTTTLAPTISGGVLPYRYLWTPGGETTPTVANKGDGTYTIRVTDAVGCQTSRSVRVQSGLLVDFTHDIVCTSQAVQFTDLTTSLTAVPSSQWTWSWNFGDPASGAANTSTLQNPTHVYATANDYNVTLTVNDGQGCQGTVTKRVRICGYPQPDFRKLDSCQAPKPLFFADYTRTQRCGILYYDVDYGDGNAQHVPMPQVVFSPPYIPVQGVPLFVNTYGAPGTYNVTLTATGENNCVRSVTKQVVVHPRPDLDVLETDYIFKCNRPDSLLNATFSGIHPPLSLLWTTGTQTTTPLTSGSSTTTISASGIHGATVTDAYGCYYSDGLIVTYPLAAAIEHSNYCETVDPIQFFDKSFTFWGIKNWAWDFGDGNTFNTTVAGSSNPSHVYGTNGVYNVSLAVTDQTDCVSEATIVFPFELPDNHFVVEPTPFCLGQGLVLESPRGNYIDSLIWSFGNGDSLWIYHDQSPPYEHHYKTRFSGVITEYIGRDVMDSVLIGTIKKLGYQGIYQYPSGAGSTFEVTLRMKYNKDSCARAYSKMIDIFPALDVVIDSIVGACAENQFEFYASQNNIAGPNNAVNSWHWEIFFDEFNYVTQTDGSVKLVLNRIKVTEAFTEDFVFNFTEGGNYYAQLTVRNADGCEVRLAEQGFSVVALPNPDFCFLYPCVSSQTQYFSFCGEYPEVVIDSLHWSFGDGNTANVNEPFNIYQAPGIYNVELEIFNTSFGCKNQINRDVEIFPRPIPDFTADPVCVGQAISFQDVSAAVPPEQLNLWTWNFGDGNLFSTGNAADRSPTHLYAEAGDYDVQLIVQSNTSGCTDTIVKKVSVHPNPVADFTFTENDLVRNRPILFTDLSTGAVKWKWFFGDGDSVINVDPLNRSVLHTYNSETQKYEIKQIVYNSFNCTDTLIKYIDLKVGIIVPNGFSPNGDGNNDGFSLIYKGIEKLYDFRVYNRWGEVVFDAGDDLKATWDGTFRGKDQPVGTYVYYVKARTLEQEDVVLSGNITLLR
jgi:gliding motility-associated-like protein